MFNKQETIKHLNVKVMKYKLAVSESNLELLSTTFPYENLFSVVLNRLYSLQHN